MTDRLVSIIVPCYDTVRYLEECLSSVLGQSYAHLEVIAVDDGSTDGSAVVLAEWTARDPRLRVVTQENAGLGAARNSGIAVARGDYLAFVDSDDIVPLDAIERMVATIERTGSDFVTGVANRFDDGSQWRASLYRRGFNDDLERTHVYERPSLLNDHIICSKLFRRSFWDRHGFEFPERTLFEDIEVATRAHCLAQTVDILARPTYLWRSRPTDHVSITQDRRRPGSVSARFAALGATDAFIQGEAPPNVWRRHGMKLITIDLPLYARELTPSDESDSGYAEEFFGAARPVMLRLSPQAVSSVGPMHCLLREAVIAQSPSDARALATLLKSDSLADRIRAFRTLPTRAQRAIISAAIRRRLPSAGAVQAQTR
ncbi:MAG: glycosyltransferase family 2 protein [Ilumatobacter sp.]|uniref:glycosyltransferase family 2 protein n=1 Tax=Ilumatobacter sp. TaxID=1967498 RepID=UPI00391B6C2B